MTKLWLLCFAGLRLASCVGKWPHTGQHDVLQAGESRLVQGSLGKIHCSERPEQLTGA